MLSDSHGGVSRAAEGLQWGRVLCLRSHRQGAWAELGEKWERGGSERSPRATSGAGVKLAGFVLS